MARDVAILITWILLSSMALLLHAVCVWRSWHVPGKPVWLKLLAALPPLAAWLCWQAGQRVLPSLWLLSVASYAITRVVFA